MHLLWIPDLARKDVRRRRHLHCIRNSLLLAGLLITRTALGQDDLGGDFDPATMENPEEGLTGPAEPEQELPQQAVDDESPFETREIDEEALGEGSAGEDEDAGGAVILAGKLGGGAPFSDLDPNVAAALEVGYLFSRTGTSLGVLLDVSYFVPQAEGSAVDPRLSGADDGSYDWHAWQKALSLQPTLIYRLTSLSTSVVPYAGIGPRLYLLQTVVEGRSGDASFPISREVSAKFGVGVPLGAEITLGPGGIVGELLFQWGPLDHDITGDTHLASATLWIGYRALL